MSNLTLIRNLAAKYAQSMRRFLGRKNHSYSTVFMEGYYMGKYEAYKDCANILEKSHAN